MNLHLISFLTISKNFQILYNIILLEKEPKSPSLVLRTFTLPSVEIYTNLNTTLRNFLLRKNRLADYSSFLTEELNKDLEVHSVALVHPNFCSAKTSLNPDVIIKRK